MKKLQTFSFHLHWITLCCFLLPFFYDSCSKKPEEAADNTTVVVTPIDSNAENNIALNSGNAISEDTTKGMINQRKKTLSETAIEKHPIVKPLLIPAEDTYTGLSGIIDTIPYLLLFAMTISFILLAIGLFGKLIDKNATKMFLLLEVCALLFLAITSPPFFDYDTLWGYWLCIAFIIALILIDTYITYKQKGKEI